MPVAGEFFAAVCAGRRFAADGLPPRAAAERSSVRRASPRRPLRRAFGALMALAALGCARDLALPPASGAPIVSSFAPPHGFAGATVTLEGRGLGASPSAVEVRFGDGSAVHPTSLSGAGATLTAQVPDDATTGPITVSTTAGRGASEQEFHFDGAGHLRRGRVALDLDYRPALLDAIPLQGRTIVLVSGAATQNARLVRVADDGSQTAFGPDHVVAVRPVHGGAGFAVLDAEPDADPATAGHLRLLAGDPLAEVTVVALPKTGLIGPVSFAIDDDAKHAVALSPGGSWAIDLTKTPPTLAATPYGTLVDGPTVVWLGGDRFALTDENGLVLVDFASAARFSEVASAASNGGDLPGRVALAAGPKNLVAATDTSGGVALLDASAWPPALVGQVATTPSGVVSGGISLGLAFSADGTRLVVGQLYLNRVLTFDLTDPQRRPIAAAIVASPGGIALGPSGLAYVAARGEVDVVSPESGALVGRLAVTAGLGGPGLGGAQLRTADCGLVVEVAATGLGAILRLDPVTLTPKTTCAPLHLTAAAPPSVLASSAAGGDLLAVHGDELWHLGAADHAESAADRIVFPSGAYPDVTLSAEGDRGLAHFTPPDFVHAVLVFDPAHLGAADVAKALAMDPALIAAGANPAIVGTAAAGGRLAILGFDSVEVVDLAAAAAGRRQTIVPGMLWTDPTWSGAVVPLGMTADRLFFTAERQDGLYRFGAIALPSGVYTEGAPVPGGTDYHLLPDGRHVAWFGGDGSTARLSMAAFEPATAAAASGELDIDLPGGASTQGLELTVFPNGERAIIVDGSRDRIVVVE